MANSKSKKVNIPINDLDKKHFDEFIDNGELSDCTVVSSDGEEFRVHKVILAMKSPVFKAMFSHDFKENTENKVRIDAKAGPVKALVDYMYRGMVHLQDVSTCLGLFKLAHLYQILSIVDVIENYFIEGFLPPFCENVLDITFIAHELAREKLLKICIEDISKFTSTYKQASNWDEFTDNKTLNQMLIDHMSEWLRFVPKNTE